MSEGSTRSDPAAPSRPRRRLKAFGGDVLLIVLGVCMAVALAEVVVRVAGIGSDQLLRSDAVLGVRFIPSKSGLSQDACYRADVATNAAGWRNRDTPLRKPEDVYRVLVLGDSFMAALQVNDDQTFARALERRLSAYPLPHRVEVINFGVPSYGTDQEYLSLREFGLAYEPDLVVLAFYGQNDVSDNYKALISAKSIYPKPYFDVESDELVELPFKPWTPWPIRVGRDVATHFRLYPLVRDEAMQYPPIHRLLFQLGVVGVVPQEDRTAGNGATSWPWPQRWRRQIGVYERDEEWPPRLHAWQITELLIEQTKRTAQKAGAGFLLLELASPISVMPGSMLDGLVAGKGAAIDADKPTVHLAQIAYKRDIDLVSLVPGFRREIGGSEPAFGKYYLHCDGHWTVEGNDLAAQLAAPEIAARLARRAARK